MKNNLKICILITLFFASFVVPRFVGLKDVINKTNVEAVENEDISTNEIMSFQSYYVGKQTEYYYDEEYTIDQTPTYQVYDVPEYSGFKSWMPYNLFNKATDQYKLQQIAYTGNHGIRYVDDYACIAIGTFANTKIGQRIDLILKNGTIIQCVMADEKSDKHTDSKNIITTKSDCCSEFIVDQKVLNKDVKRDGDISSICAEWDSPVVQFYVYEENILEERLGNE